MAFLDEIGVAELWSLVRAKDLKIATGSYEGKGKAGIGNPNRLYLDFAPQLVVVGDADSAPLVMVCSGENLHCSWHNPSGAYICKCRRDNNTILWWSEDYRPVLGSVETASAIGQKDASGTTYYYVAIG